MTAGEVPIADVRAEQQADRANRSRLAVVFLLCASSFAYVEVVGQVYLVEVLLLPVALHALIGARKAESPLGATGLIVAALVWLGAQVVSNSLNGVPYTDFARGIASIGFLLTDLIALLHLLGTVPQTRSAQVVRTAFLGLCVSGALGFILQPNVFARDNPWKFGLAFPAVLLVCLALGRRGLATRALLWPSVLACLAILNFALNFRSMAGICGLTALVLLVRALTPSAARSLSKGVIIALVSATLVGAVLASAAYDRAARDGFFGSASQAKGLAQSQGEFGGLVGGRSEVFLNFEGIRESPLLGLGSYAELSPDTRAQALERLAALGYLDIALQFNEARGGTVNHSYLLGAWVAGGLAGANFWVLYIRRVVRCLTMILKRQISPSIAAACAFVGVNLLWSILFSPFGAEQRFAAALAASAFLVLSSERRVTA